uniref:Uncharacterized protein n=1 Tax=Candidatus Methanophaga sp. ANME-1 ERB7 TaxID=2759913 RepID=A0A7G9ZBZ5_9EURY|nr:hypothetical protein OHAEDELL_00006 [Methanosarcinales archaeon ANME-1 ERB7]
MKWKLGKKLNTKRLLKKAAPEEEISDEEIRKENVKVMKGIISKYLKKKEWSVEDASDYVTEDEDMGYPEAAEYAKAINALDISNDFILYFDADYVSMTIDTEDFDDDLEKLRKLFHKRGIDTAEGEIISLFVEIIREIIREYLNKKVEKEIIPLYKTIPKRLGKNPTTREVIEEFMNMPLFDHSTPVINIMRISRLLSKFNIKKDEKIIGEILEKLSEEAELEEFEEELM